ncbi:hypothetical protein [Peribacillus sp. SI8-4]|uniref:hypothetical protein n=1 Tax=Peribacillus sp. SI8-4 TaxID=3048009 RepID=UPI00255538D4|nr:hypothetical protein [Peribacillus sp. SI8-4]
MRYIILLMLVMVHFINDGSSETTVFADSKLIISTSQEANVFLYANSIDRKYGMYRGFDMKIDGETRYFPYWVNVTNPSYAPRILYKDLNQDNRKDLIIVLTKGYGTEVLDNEVHVLNKTQTSKGEIYEEVLVDNPVAIIFKNVKTKLTQHEAVVSIGDTKTVMNIENLHIPQDHLFDALAFGSIVKFDVADGHLVASVGGQITPAMFIGTIEITYEYKEKMYQAKKIEFKTNSRH